MAKPASRRCAPTARYIINICEKLFSYRSLVGSVKQTRMGDTLTNTSCTCLAQNAAHKPPLIQVDEIVCKTNSRGFVGWRILLTLGGKDGWSKWNYSYSGSTHIPRLFQHEDASGNIHLLNHDLYTPSEKKRKKKKKNGWPNRILVWIWEFLADATEEFGQFVSVNWKICLPKRAFCWRNQAFSSPGVVIISPRNYSRGHQTSFSQLCAVYIIE